MYLITAETAVIALAVAMLFANCRQGFSFIQQALDSTEDAQMRYGGKGKEFSTLSSSPKRSPIHSRR